MKNSIFQQAAQMSLLHSTYTTEDQFHTHNNFYGGQIGLNSSYTWNNFFVELRGQLALGGMVSKLKAKLEYGGKKEGTFKPMKNTQTEMGKISNLITDMTLKGATQDELARAVRHSMVVIDAEKHKLDYKQSEQDNGISALRKKYQGTVDENGRYHEGAATLILVLNLKPLF